MSTSSAPNDFNALVSAPKFSDDPIGHRQKQRWHLIAGDIHKSISIEAMLEARGKAEGYIHGVVDAVVSLKTATQPRDKTLDIRINQPIRPASPGGR